MDIVLKFQLTDSRTQAIADSELGNCCDEWDTGTDRFDSSVAVGVTVWLLLECEHGSGWRSSSW